jgi:hypothetical protein
MIGIDDLILGFVISKLFGSANSGPAKSPAVVFPPAGGGTAPAPAPQPAPQQQPAQPAQLPPGTPVFPSQVVPPPAQQGADAPAGFKRAIEVWQVNPSIAQQAAPALSGLPVGAEAVTIQMLEAGFPKGWQGKKSATDEEAANAKRLLSQWKDGNVLFLGPATLAARRAYRMTKHPVAATPGALSQPAPFQTPQVAPQQAAVPTPVSNAPGPVPGTTVTTMSDGSKVTTIPEITITPGPDAGPQITTVRKGEGLANIAKRLGFPATGASATAIQKANVPTGPDAQWTATALAKGGLAKKGRAGGLQPGDRLFVPPSWTVDPGAL